MLTPFDPLIATFARGLDYLSPRFLPPPTTVTSVQVGNGWRLTLPARMPSARRLLAGAYEPEVSALISGTLRLGMTFIDAGANVGYYTLLAANLVGTHGRVYAFEPDEDAFRYLETNVRSNGIHQVVTLRKALADEPGSRTFTRSALEGGFISPLSSRSRS